MKKIYLSIMAIVLTVGLVSGATYALFSDTVTISGLTVTAGNADLQINLTTNNTNEGFVNNWSTPLSYNDLYPGFEGNGDFWLRNISDSNISLRPVARLTSAGGDWTALKDKIQLRVTDLTNGSYSWGWQTLAWWNSEARTLTDTNGILAEALDLNTAFSHDFKIEVKVLESAGNEIADKNLTNITFEIVATQILP